MLRCPNNTDIGGPGGGFQTTHWSEIFDARTGEDARRNIIIESLLRRYWKPVYCYIRHRKYNNEEAKDLTQGFFHEVLLSKDLLQQADRAKSRFRTLLLTALDHYLATVHRKKKAKKRMPQGQILPLEANDLPDLMTAQRQMRPDQVFNYVWATELIDQVISQVRAECLSTGKATHWAVFSERILRPIMEGGPVPSLRRLRHRHRIDSEAKASNMIITVKRCFRRVLEDRLRAFVQTDSEIEAELNELFEIIAERSAGY